MEVAVMATQLNASGGGGGGYGSKKMEIRWIRSRVFSDSKSKSKSTRKRIPIFISTNPSIVKPQDLKELCRKCNHSCSRFPQNGKVNDVEAVDLKKLGLALSHSSMLVSVFCNSRDLVFNEEEVNRPLMGLGDLLRTKMTPLPPSDAQLVGFGRAVSDFGLTAAIYDVMVIPSLQRMGIGIMIVKRMTRMLTSRGIYDISALCSVNERLFFKACGFGDDILGSTTMMYTRTASTYSEGRANG